MSYRFRSRSRDSSPSPPPGHDRRAPGRPHWDRYSPNNRPSSPSRRPFSPPRRPFSPPRRPLSPPRRPLSPPRRPLSPPIRRLPSPLRGRLPSPPPRRLDSPPRRSSPAGWESSPRRNGRSWESPPRNRRWSGDSVEERRNSPPRYDSRSRLMLPEDSPPRFRNDGRRIDLERPVNPLFDSQGLDGRRLDLPDDGRDHYQEPRYRSRTPTRPVDRFEQPRQDSRFRSRTPTRSDQDYSRYRSRSPIKPSSFDSSVRERSRPRSPREVSPRRYTDIKSFNQRSRSPREFSPRRSAPLVQEPYQARQQFQPHDEFQPRHSQQSHYQDRRPPSPPPTRSSSNLSQRSEVISRSQQTGRIREYIDDLSGIIELPKTADGQYPSAYFHADTVFVPNPNGNPYGPPVRFSDAFAGNSHVSIRDVIPMGTDLQLNAVKLTANKYFDLLATAVWPKTAETPANPSVDMDRLMVNLRRFMEHFEKTEPVYAAVHGLTPTRLKPASAQIWEILDENFGTIELKVTSRGVRFFALFHKEDVYLKDGKRAVEHEFFRDKPLNAMVTVGQPCSLSARSIILSKGANLKTAVLELQAIVVSLNPDAIPLTAPRASRLSGGPGTFGLSLEFSPYFFQMNLANRLNQKLVQHLKISGKRYPDLDESCLQVIREPEHDPTTPHSSRSISETASLGQNNLSAKLTNYTVTVRELLSDHSGILEDMDRRWKCFFTSRHCLLRPKATLREVFPPGSTVSVNASLIDAKRQIQYLASLVWSRDEHPSREIIGKSVDIDQSLLQKYFDVNEIFAFDDKVSPPQPDASPDAKTSTPLPSYYDVQEGTVLRLLDDNFALIQVESTLTLFDVCDFWLDPARTASKEGIKMGEVVEVGTKVIFHAALLMEDARIQYLASSVWLKNAPGFVPSNRPKAIRKEDIHKEKVDIFKMVVQSVSDALPSVEAMTPLDARDISMRKFGIVRVVVMDGSAVIGGIVEFDIKKFCFFLLEHCSGLTGKIQPGLKVYFNAARVRDPSASGWSVKIGFVALSVYASGEVEEDRMAAKAKVEASVIKMGEIVQRMGRDLRFLQDLSHPKQPIIRLPAKAVTVQEVESYGYFKCMLSDTSGLLEDRDKKDTLVYFEINDVNIKNDIPLIDLVSLLNKHPGIEVRYYASKVNEGGKVHMVAHDKGVHLIGELPRSMQTTVQRVKVSKEEMQPGFDNRGKRQRFREGERKFASGDFKTWSDLSKTLKLPESIVHQTGIVKFILNENFGLVFGPQGHSNRQSYCLFDTYDLHLSNLKTAADADLSVAKVVSLGDAVMYNACLIKPESEVPFLATAVWQEGKLAQKPLALDKVAIQKDKIAIYQQVIQSCEAMLVKKKEPEKAKPKSPPPTSASSSETIKDSNTTGTMHEQKCDLFAILELSTGEKALLSNHRVWINNKPKFGGWRPLYLEYFKKINVNARRVSGYADFQWQVTFCHAGMNKRNWKTKKFDYPPDMVDWIESVDKTSSLDAELVLYKSRHA